MSNIILYLEDEDTAALGHDETTSVRVERSAGGLRTTCTDDDNNHSGGARGGGGEGAGRRGYLLRCCFALGISSLKTYASFPKGSVVPAPK